MTEADVATLLSADAGMFTHAHLPAAACCRKLGLIEIVDEAVTSQMDVIPGVVVQAMVLDTLAGRSPLYRIEKFLASQDVELLLGKRFKAGQFNDTNLARALDAIYEAGTGRVLGALGVAATKIFGLDASCVRYDTTSVSVWGDYADCGGDSPPSGPRIVLGHSKDHRPDLKQSWWSCCAWTRPFPYWAERSTGTRPTRPPTTRC